MELKGVYTAIVTPFGGDGNVDEEGLRSNVEQQIQGGVKGLVPVGTTGESATLSEAEHKKVIEIVIDQVNGRAQVLAGTGSNNTEEAIAYTRHAKDVGADAALMITPYYNKPTQEGVYQHYRKIAQSVDIPIVLYTVPSRTMVNIEPDTVQRLSGIPNIVAIKDATGNLDQLSRELMLCGDDFTVLSGEDSITLPMISLGASGVISVSSNVVPNLMVDMVEAALSGDYGKAREVHYRIYPLMKTLFIETNPAPVKAAMDMIGLAAGKPRLPLVPVTDQSREKIREVLSGLGLV